MQRFLSYENTILAVVMMVSFINPFTSSALTTALPGVGTAYGATDAQLSWVIELFLISSTVTIMPISKIADRIGKRHVFLFGVSLFCVSSLAVYFVTSLYGLFLLRILQGLGSASIFATSMAIVSLVTPPERRGRAMGFTIAAVYCGLSFGPVLGGFFSYYLGWKTIFYFIAIICAVAWLIALYSMKKEEWIVNAHGSLDLFGSLLYALAMIAIMVGLSEVTSLFYAKYSWPPASSCSWCSCMVNGTGKARSCPSVFLPTIACFPVPVWQLCSTTVQLLASVSSCPFICSALPASMPVTRDSSYCSNRC